MEQVDVLIVGAGPAGLSAALSLYYHSHISPVRGSQGPKPKIFLVDALSQGQNESRALGFHSRTLEALDSIGCAEPLSPYGIHSQEMAVQSAPQATSEGAHLLTVEWKELEGKTKYPYTLLVPQHVTERVLGELVSERVKNSEGYIRFSRSMRLVNLEEMQGGPDGQTKGILASFENGSQIWCRYLVGADGARSTIRTLSQITFSDPALALKGQKAEPESYTCIVDALFEEDLGIKHSGLQQGLVMTLGHEGIFLFAPVIIANVESTEGDEPQRRDEDKTHRKDQYWYRLACRIPSADWEYVQSILNPKRDYSTGSQDRREGYISTPEAVAYVQRRLDMGFRFCPTNPNSVSNVPISPSRGNIPKVKEIIWASTFKIRYAVAQEYWKIFPTSDSNSPSGDAEAKLRGGHVLLVGDAAHIHSPAGGQGMNLGICDGIACGQAIAEHMVFSSSSPSESSTPNPNPKTPLLQIPVNPLAEYAAARHKQAVHVIEFTKRLSWFTILGSSTSGGSGGRLAAAVRDWVLWCFGRPWITFARRNIVWNMSGLARV